MSTQEHTYQEGDWAKVADALNRFLMYTQQISTWTEENADAPVPDMLTLEDYIRCREDALNEIKEVHPGLANAGALSDTEEASREAAKSLVASIEAAELGNTASLRGMSKKIGEKLRGQKQARDTLSAYGAASYNQAGAVGSRFNQAR